MLTLITIILSSTVLSAFVTGIVSSNMKRKELEVKIKLDEKNKWISNVDKKLNELIENVNGYSGELMQYSVMKNKDKVTDQLITDKIVDRLLDLKKTHSNLIFYIYQVEYAEIQKNKVEKIMRDIVEVTNNQKEQVLKYTSLKNNTMNIQDLKIKMGESEEILAEKTYYLSENMGNLVRLEKIEMTNEILNNKIKEIILSILK